MKVIALHQLISLTNNLDIKIQLRQLFANVKPESFYRKKFSQFGL